MRAAAFLAVLALPAQADSLALPPGATRASEDFTALASYAVPTAAWSLAGLPVEEAEGRLVREAWHIPGEATTLQLLEPLRAQLQAQGYTILFECETRACGGFDFRFETEVLPEPDMHVDLADFRYLSAKREGEGNATEWVTLMVSRSSGTGYLQFFKVAPVTAPEEDLATKSPELSISDPVSPTTVRPVETAEGIGGELDAKGRAILPNLTFETGSSRLAGTNFPSLDELATYLRTHPSRKITLVGHTDAAGSLDANIALSRARARAVVEKLVADYDIPAGQLAADGVGYLMPLASNLTDEGRAINRRVEAVLTATE